MAEIVLFHHAQGVTEGVVAFADELRGAGHVVHVPDLYEGRTFASLDEGIAHAQAIGFPAIVERGRAAVAQLPGEIVFAGMSLGVLPAQNLAMERPGARGAVLLHGALGLDEDEAWPDGVPLQLHTMAGDELGDAEVGRELAEAIPSAELFLYEGDAHLFTDNSLEAYNSEAAGLVRDRVLAFLDALG
jgi:dienelactone hydrolase